MPKLNKYFIIDFDSTFVQSEGFEELAELALAKNPRKTEIIKKIKQITNLGMEGKVNYRQSLLQRLKLLQGTKLHLNQVVKILRKKISRSVLRNKEFFKKYKKNIFIISGGFREFIAPIVKPFNIPEQNIFANTFNLDKKGKITGFNMDNPLSQDGGKVKVVKNLGLDGEIIAIGDGYSDYQLKKMGAAKHFVAFTENIQREIVITKADQVAANFDEFLFYNKLPRSLSYPKNRIKVVILDRNEELDLEIFKQEGYQVLLSSRKITDAQILIASDFKNILKKPFASFKSLLAVGLFEKNRYFVESFLNDRGVGVFSDGEKLCEKIVKYINTGNSLGSINIPNLSLKKTRNSHRILYLSRNRHKNNFEIKRLIKKFRIRILARKERKNKYFYYFVADIAKNYPRKFIFELKKILGTVRLRMLY